MTTKRRALGRGLAALIPGASPQPPIEGKIQHFLCPIEEIEPSPHQPRQTFDEASLEELANSIRQHGLIQPILVRERKGGGFVLIAGERRWRAAQRAGLKEIPVIIKEATAAEAFELALVENLQRDDLNPIEEAEAYRRLIEDFGYTQDQLAQRVGKDRSTVANALRLLKLPQAVRTLCATGQLSMGHARALLGCESEKEMVQLAHTALRRGLSVRQIEEAVRKLRRSQDTHAGKQGVSPSAQVRDLEERLRRSLGTRVRIVQKNTQAGRIEIHYTSLDELDRLLDRLLMKHP